MDYEKLEVLMNELIAAQEKTLFEAGRRIVPTLTMEDMLQPNDFDELEYNPYFRYEEGVLAGLLTAKTAIMTEIALTEKQS